MVKLFGWEGKMSKMLQERRSEELNAVWKLKVPFSLPLDGSYLHGSL